MSQHISLPCLFVFLFFAGEINEPEAKFVGFTQSININNLLCCLGSLLTSLCSFFSATAAGFQSMQTLYSDFYMRDDHFH